MRPYDSFYDRDMYHGLTRNREEIQEMEAMKVELTEPITSEEVPQELSFDFNPERDGYLVAREYVFVCFQS